MESLTHAPLDDTCGSLEDDFDGSFQSLGVFTVFQKGQLG